MATLRIERGVTLDAYLIVWEPVPDTEPVQYVRMDLTGLGARLVLNPRACSPTVLLALDSADEESAAQWLTVEPPAEDVPEQFVDPDDGTKGLLWLHLGATATENLTRGGEMRFRVYDPLDVNQVTPVGTVTVVVEP